MTDQPGAEDPQVDDLVTFLNALEATDAYPKVRRAHSAMKRAEGSEGLYNQLAAVLSAIARAGRHIEGVQDRAKVQSILDYWTMVLISSRPEVAFTNEPLSPFEGAASGAAPQSAAQQATPATITTERRRSGDAAVAQNNKTAIRIAAVARLWRDSPNLDGFLLDGAALKLAEQNVANDDAVRQLVTASKSAIYKRAKQRWLLVVISSLLSAAMLLTAYYIVIPRLAKHEVRMLVGNNSETISRRQIRFRLLAIYQKIMPPADLSELYLTSSTFDSLSLDNISLPGANFIRSEMRNVRFDHSQLARSQFADSPLLRDVYYVNANLKMSNFSGATIFDSNFSKSDLYRATFDNANLCNVNFSGSSLRFTTFRGAFVDRYDGFVDTAWWLATGWSSTDHSNLMKIANDQGRRAKSAGFEQELDSAWKFVEQTAADTFDKASALNSYAFILATWGFPYEVPGLANSQPSATRSTGATCGDSSGVPRTALGAATSALCILGRIETSDAVKDLTSKIYDNRAHIYLQQGNVEKALDDLNMATGLRDEDGGTFRRLLTLYASGKKEEALAALPNTLEKYTPSYELWTLRKFLLEEDGKHSEFLDKTFAAVDKRWPSTNRSCNLP